MRAYAADLRERVIHLREKGETQGAIAKCLTLSVSSIKRYLSRYQATGSIAETVQKRQPPTLGAADLAIIEAQLHAHSDGTLPMHIEWFVESSGRRVSPMTMSRAIHRLGWTRKKRRWVRVNAI